MYPSIFKEFSQQKCFEVKTFQFFLMENIFTDFLKNMNLFFFRLGVT